MQILAFNGSPRQEGNTSTIIRAILEGARSAGAETTEVRLHDINMKGCMGCLSCRKKPGVCAQQDDLTSYLEAIKSCDGLVIGCPIYMYRISGQMKCFVDRCYSLYVSREGGGYDSAVPPGKTYALVVSQGAADPDQYKKSARWLAAMTGSGFGMEEAGRIIHSNSHLDPAKDNDGILDQARQIGRRLLKKDQI
ncbi:MAG: flavodoxin family protein [Deltaproteobacteria bacterium]|nr:flavodoxin family protein [Deltaproteobacteria bacterium]